MNRSRNAAVALLALVLAASAMRDGLAHGPQMAGRNHAPANVVTVPPPYLPVWIPGSGPGYPAPWLPAMPPSSNVGSANGNNILSQPPPEVPRIFPDNQEHHVGDLSADERKSLKLACGSPQVQGVAAFHQCMVGQLNVLRAAGPRPNLNVLSPSERSSVELACKDAMRQGPARYNHCCAVHAREVHR